MNNPVRLARTVLATAALVWLASLGVQLGAQVPGRPMPGGAVPNPGTQQQELTNITAPAEWNVFEFVVTCGACHGGTVDQHVGHFANWAGGSMASAARDPIFRANQIGVNHVVKSITGQDGAGNVCFRCHSPNGWLSGRFDPTLGGKADGSSMMNSILLSTDAEGIMCETCHRVVGGVTTKRQGLDGASKTWNLLAGIYDWEHMGRTPTDQAGTSTMATGLPFGDTSLQFNDAMTYTGKYSGMTDVYFSDVPINAGDQYTGQIYAIYPPNWVASGLPVLTRACSPLQNSVGDDIAYNPDCTIAPIFETPIGVPSRMAGGMNQNMSQSFSIEHPTVGSAGRSGSRLTANTLYPVLPAGPGGSASPNEFIRTSEFCGACHDLTVPVLNHGMPEQRTFTEWKYSAYSMSSHTINDPLKKRSTSVTGVTGPERCQDCHMPTLRHEYTDDDNGGYNADPSLVGGFPYGKDRNAQGGTAVHKLAGANRDLPMMMKALYPEVDLEVIGAPTGKDPRTFPGMLSDRGPMWDRAKQNAELTMRDGLDVQIVQAPMPVAGGSIDLNGNVPYEMKVKVINKSGHRIPTGYPDGRRFWLEVKATNEDDVVVYQSGAYDAATATLKTTPTTGFARAMTNTIDASVQNAVMVYERVTGTCLDATGTAIFPNPTDGTPVACNPSSALTNNFMLFDNRIPPMGFAPDAAREGGVKYWTYLPGTLPGTVVPAEDRLRYDAAMSAGGFDLVTYRFLAPQDAVLSATAEAYWQTHTRDFMEHLRNQDTTTVRPEGPPNPFDLGYPFTPNYLSASINGKPLTAITDPFQPAVALNDNWGGVAYAAWLETGMGAPFLVDRDDTTSTAAPGAPTGVTVTSTGEIDPVTAVPDVFSARIAWNTVADADGYVIWVRYGKNDLTADWDRLAVVGADATSFVERVFNPGKTYGFKVVAYNGKGEAESAVVEYTVAGDLPVAPNALSASTTAPGSSPNQITLTWFDNAANDVCVDVWRFDVVATGVPPVTQFTCVVATPDTTGPATGLVTWVDTSASLQPNTQYDYQVRAQNVNAEVSTWSQLARGQTTGNAVTINLTATAVSGFRVNVGWVVNPAGVSQFRVIRDGALLTTVVPTASTTYSFADTTVVPSTAYVYVLEAVSGITTTTATASVTTPDVPLAPTGLQTVAGLAQITVSWIDNANNEDGFILERAVVTNGTVGMFQPIPAVGAFFPPNTTTYVDAAGLLANTLYVYRVKAIHLVNGDSGYAVGTPVSLLAPPAAPTALQAVLGGLPGTLPRVVLNWVDNANSETGFELQRHVGTNQCAAATGWTVLPAQAANVTSYVNTGVGSGGYCYRVRATNAAGASAWVAAVVTVPNQPGTAASPAVNGATETSLNVRPAGNLNGVIGYQVRYRRSNGNANWTTLPAVAGTAATTVSGLTGSTAYTFAVKVATFGGWSNNWSNTTNGTTLAPPTAPNAPSAPNVSNPGNCSNGSSGNCMQTVGVTIANANPATSGWVLQRCQGNTTGSNNSSNALTGNNQVCGPNGAGWSQIASGNAAVNNLSVPSAGLLDNTFYSYRVNSTNALGTSGWSNVTSSKRQ